MTKTFYQLKTEHSALKWWVWECADVFIYAGGDACVDLVYELAVVALQPASVDKNIRGKKKKNKC